MAATPSGAGGQAPGPARTHSRDLALDLFVRRAADGRHELWLKDEDELEAAVAAGTFSAELAGLALAAGEHAARELFDRTTPFEPGPDFHPTATQDVVHPLPDTPLIRSVRDLRHG
ncbi:hypothetical protein [Kytococcus aerolatus]|uniref:hypothetical protein n=1 Tax=Kytococcus aerolatus TaxID=592308 RepID=UPI000B590112|nr:hypothetical protein [Kytococcus aerolatus]